MEPYEKPPAAYAVGEEIFKEYRMKNFIGQGGFGRVFLVENQSGIPFALKVLHRNVGMERRGVESVKRVRSSYLVNIIDFGATVKDESCILMEYVRDNLRETLDKGGIDEKRASRYFVQILKGLDVLEKNAVPHRDIKPENLFISDDIVKIGDFGNARYTSGDSSKKSQLVGTMHYMAPERFSSAYGHSVDRWAAGVVFYRMLTGDHLFPGTDHMQVFGAIMRGNPDVSAAPEKYRDFFSRCFETDVKKRFADAKAMREAFETCENPSAKKGETPAENPPKIHRETQDSQPEAEPKPGPPKPKQPVAESDKEPIGKPVQPKPIPPKQRKKKAFQIAISALAAILLVALYSPVMSYLGKRLHSGAISTPTPTPIPGTPTPTPEIKKYGLYIQTDPSDAIIRFVDSKREYRKGMELEPGSYDVEVTREGYTPKTLPVKIENQALTTSVRLDPMEWKLTIQPEPADATVQIVNIKPKYQPGMALPPGTYHIAVLKKGYKPHEAWIDITNSHKTIPVTLVPEKRSDDIVKLRSDPNTLSDNDIREMIKKHNFYCKKYGWSEKWYNETGDFKNDFTDNGDTVTDHATGLMWQKSGSDNSVTYEKAGEYVKKLNRDMFAGYDDWRMPTIEELASLLENEEKNGRYINPVFDKTQAWCWSSDRRSSGSAWVVDFSNGGVNWYWGDLFVRCVRRGQ